MNRGWLTGLIGDGVNDYAYAQEGVNVGIAVFCSAATSPRLAFKDVIFRAGGTRYHD